MTTAQKPQPVPTAQPNLTKVLNLGADGIRIDLCDMAGSEPIATMPMTAAQALALIERLTAAVRYSVLDAEEAR